MIKYQQIIQNKDSIMTFGKYKGSRVRNLPKGYLWALYNYGWIKISRKFFREFQLMISRPKSNRSISSSRFNTVVWYDRYGDPAERAFRDAYGI